MCEPKKESLLEDCAKIRAERFEVFRSKLVNAGVLMAEVAIVLWTISLLWPTGEAE